ncbi:MAG: RNA polymerase sigma factor, partial [Phycisphaerae bacterium]
SSYMSPALAVAQQILSDHALAEDAVQESFLKVIRKRQQYIPGSPFSCWFYAIVRNVCVDILRKQARRKKVIEETSISGEPSTQQTDLSEISKLLDVLTSGERDVLVLRIVHGLRFRDVAAALGISEEAAKKRAQRALKRLRLSKILISKF